MITVDTVHSLLKKYYLLLKEDLINNDEDNIHSTTADALIAPITPKSSPFSDPSSQLIRVENEATDYLLIIKYTILSFEVY